MKEHLRFATCYWHTFTWPGLDPFGGAGTTAIVADRNDRNCTLIELNSSYVKMANDRIGNYVMKEKFPEQGRLL